MNQAAAHDPLRVGTLQEALDQAMNEEEFNKVCEILGRTPNVTELAIFAVMWSEHCSYKNSILELKTLPRSGSRLLAEAGAENAGLVDIGDGFAVAFKIESHNHPSAVEPFQGAATGVGGILRDVFTMGARPLASLNSLRFGDLSNPRNQFLLDGVVRGIGHYGNCFGVPTVAGEVCFDLGYQGNPLVNAMAAGVVKTGKIATAKAQGIGNPVFYVGSRTGRDGTHGATFASEELTEDNESKRSAVQVGDPFAEKLLLEATLELCGSEALVAIQDMGAAGLTCSSSEMAAAGGVGMELNLDLVPLREEDLDPWEIMLSESQERMLLIAKAGHEEAIKRVFDKWELEAVEIGKVTDDGRLKLWHNGKQVANVPTWNLVLGGGAPQYKREFSRPPEIRDHENFDLNSIPPETNPQNALMKLLSDPEIASKRWIYQQYDQSVRTNTILEPGYGDAAVIRVEGSNKALALKTDGNSRYVRLNPRIGSIRNVVESALNVACTGARPVAITNCLNFGNPYKPEVYYYFHEAVAGMGEACRAFDTPVTGGNVSFHNETNGVPVAPTPVIGMLGLLEDCSKSVPCGFKNDGDEIYLLGNFKGNGLGGSSYLQIMHGKITGRLDPVNLDEVKCLLNLLVAASRECLIQSAHDVSDGGLAVCLAECCISGRYGQIGARIEHRPDIALNSLLFGEIPGLVVISASPEKVNQLRGLAEENSVSMVKIGTVGGGKFTWNEYLDISLEEISDIYFNSIETILESSE